MKRRQFPTYRYFSHARARNPHFPLTFYMTDDQRLLDPLPQISTLKQGSGVIFRHYRTKRRRDLGKIIKKFCLKRGLLFFVAKDLSLAQDLNADGLHVPEHMLDQDPMSVRLWGSKKNKLITASAHTEKALLKCHRLKVDAVFVSPVFPTQSDSEKTALGVIQFQKIAFRKSIPVFALGGINKKSVMRLKNTRITGIAGISNIADVML